MDLTEEQWKRRQEGIANLPPRVKPEPEPENIEADNELLQREYGRLEGDGKPKWQSARKPDVKLDNKVGRLIDSVGTVDKPPNPITPETVQARPTGTVPEKTTETVAPGEKTASKRKLNTGATVGQVKCSQNTKLTDHCAYVTINDQLTNCHTINWTEKALLAMVNFNTGSYGYASISFQQLGHWLAVKPGTVKNMVNKLEKLKFLEDLGNYNGKHRLTVRPKWRNPDRKKADEVPF